VTPAALLLMQRCFKTALGRLLSGSQHFILSKLFVPPVTESKKEARKQFFAEQSKAKKSKTDE
jgi:hypothetical protein